MSGRGIGQARARPSGQGGALPDFVIIGAMRAGTTTLHRCLGAHPEIGMSREKETDFFIAERNLRRGLGWYRSQFDPEKPLNGEASPNYSKRDMFAGVPERIHAALPHCRIIYVVRDPVERAISQLRFVQRTNPRLTFEDKFKDITRASLYMYQLRPYVELFGRDRVLVVDFHLLKVDPAAALARIGDFLGVRAGWGEGVAPVAVNSIDELAALPAWAIGLRQVPPVAALRRRLPRRAVDLARRALAHGPRGGRAPAEIDARMRERLRRAVAQDAAAFRAFTGMAFASWSV